MVSSVSSPSAERIPPQAIQVEQAVLGALLLDTDAIAKALELIEETTFYREAHRKIFLAIVALYERGEAVDLVTLTEELNRRKQLDDVGGAFYLAELLDSVATSANVEYHLRIIQQKAVLRNLINVATQIAARAYDGGESPDDLLDQAEQMIFALSEKRLRRSFTQLNPILHDTFEAIEKLHEREATITGVPSGYSRMDDMTAGFQPADLIIIAGRPSMGKTAFALNIARNAAVDHKIGVGIFSLEMANHQLAQRLLCSEARINSHTLRTGRLKGSSWSQLSIAVGSLAQSPIFIDDSPGLTVLEVRAKARRLVAEYNIGLLIIDYLQLMRGPAGMENRQQEISQISRALKGLAKELDVPVIALSQLSRAVETRGGDCRPQLSDLRESGAIEQDADVVMFVYRGELYGKAEEGEAEVIIGKQRNGPTGTIRLSFLKDYARFEERADMDEMWDPGRSSGNGT